MRTNPFALALLPGQYQAYVNAWMDIAHMDEQMARRAVTYAVGREGSATYDNLRCTNPVERAKEIQAHVLTAMGHIMDPNEAKKIVTLGLVLNLTTPVVEWKGRIVFPYTIQGDTIEMAKANDEWTPPKTWNTLIVGKPERTQFGFDPYNLVLTGPDTMMVDYNGTKLPCPDEGILQRADGKIHEWWGDIKLGSGDLTLIIAVLLHHEDFKRFASSPELAFALLVNPTHFGLNQILCQRIRNASETIWQRGYQAYAALLVEQRSVVQVSTGNVNTQAAPPQKFGGHSSDMPSTDMPEVLVEWLFNILYAYKSDDLRMHLRSYEYTRAIAGNLPGEAATAAHVIHAAAQGLVQHGVTWHFLNYSLLPKYPGRQAEIQAVMAKVPKKF